MEMHGGAKRTWGMAGERYQHQLAVPEYVALAGDGIRWLSVVPIGPQIAGRLRPGRVRSLDFRGMHQDGRLLEKLVAAAMIGMKVRVDDDVDIVRIDTDTRQTRQQRVLRAHHWRHDF